MKNKYFYVLAASFIIILTNCKKLVTVDLPKNQQTTSSVFADTLSTRAALVNVYALIDKTTDPQFNKYSSLFTDELTKPGTPADEFWNSNLSTNNSIVLNFWKNSYFGIYSCNEVISQMSENLSLPTTFKTSVTAEAKFLRAYFYFTLVNTYGDVPLVLSSDVNVNAKKGREAVAFIYDQILNDLGYAEANLYNSTTSGSVRVNKWAAKALLARVYLYQKKWKKAEDISTEIISSEIFSLLQPLSQVFINTSKETIFQIWTPNGYVSDAITLIPASGRPTYVLSSDLLSAFAPGDQRKSKWTKAISVSGTTYTIPFKYHNRTPNSGSSEYLVLFRLAEQYLIRAESRANLNDLSGAVSDVNVVRRRAGLPDLPSDLTKADCLTVVYMERRLEFFLECGHRFFDLRRSNRLAETIKALKPAWPLKSISFPIPQNEITYNQSLNQNTGY